VTFSSIGAGYDSLKFPKVCAAVLRHRPNGGTVINPEGAEVLRMVTELLSLQDAKGVGIEIPHAQNVVA
jgi:hypothetical protein